MPAAPAVEGGEGAAPAERLQDEGQEEQAPLQRQPEAEGRAEEQQRSLEVVSAEEEEASGDESVQAPDAGPSFSRWVCLVLSLQLAQDATRAHGRQCGHAGRYRPSAPASRPNSIATSTSVTRLSSRQQRKSRGELASICSADALAPPHEVFSHHTPRSARPARTQAQDCQAHV